MPTKCANLFISTTKLANPFIKLAEQCGKDAKGLMEIMQKFILYNMGHIYVQNGSAAMLKWVKSQQNKNGSKFEFPNVVGCTSCF